jgi:hypothetical protein
MKNRVFPSFFLSLLFAGSPITAGAASSADVVFYGATAAGVMGAIQAHRSGLKTVVISPSERIGGMTTGGLGATDFGSKTSVSGLAKEFYQRIYETYLEPSRWVHETRDEFVMRHPDTVSEDLKMQWFFEPKVALEVLEKMLAETGVEIWKGVDLAEGGVLKSGNTITGLRLSDGRELQGKMFVDTSYEGDLMAAAGVPYVTGREANSEFHEELNGIRVNDRKKTGSISPFIIPGDRSSGLLPLVEGKRPGADGEGDHRVQAYNYRMCLTDAEVNRRPVEKPANYDPKLYELAARWILAHPKATLGKSLFKLTPMPNRKTDSNNQGPFSTDFVGMSYDYAEADRGRREEVARAHRDYIQGFLWFLGNDPRIPASLRAEVSRWGLPKDEFEKNGNWPTQLYVREARRMRGGYVVSQSDAEKKTVAEDPVALAAYAMDSHSVSRFVDEDGLLSIEGAFWRGVKPFGISYKAIIPQAEHCANLLVPVCLSSTHAAYGSIRMEPVFMMLSQAAALAAALAVNDAVPVQSVNYDKLRKNLDDAGLVYEWRSSGQTAAVPAASSEPLEADAGAVPDGAPVLEQLQQAGVIEDVQRWQMVFETRAPCPTAMTSELLISAASKLADASDVDAAIDVLQANGVIGDANYWRERIQTAAPVPAQWIIDFSSKLLKTLKGR